MIIYNFQIQFLKYILQSTTVTDEASLYKQYRRIVKYRYHF